MSIIQIIDAFTFYGLDVISLAALTCVFVQLLKITLFKRCKKKVLTFLPFVIGCVLYAAYSAVYRLDFCWVVKNYVYVIEHGFSVGALSTVVYVCYEQFVRDKKCASPAQGVIATLIEEYVPDGRAEEVAARIAEAIEKDVTGDGAKKAAAILCENADGEMSEADVKLLAKLIIETLAHVNTPG